MQWVNSRAEFAFPSQPSENVLFSFCAVTMQHTISVDSHWELQDTHLPFCLTLVAGHLRDTIVSIAVHPHPEEKKKTSCCCWRTAIWKAQQHLQKVSFTTGDKDEMWQLLQNHLSQGTLNNLKMSALVMLLTPPVILIAFRPSQVSHIKDRWNIRFKSLEV